MFARTRRGLKIYETTLTQNILFALRRFQEICTDYSLSLDEAIDESSNGNDIELIVQTSSGYVKLPTQAKLLYSNLKYTAISHPGSTRYQVDDLINYASSIGGIPMYLLYNFLPCHHALRDHGCTMLMAEYIRNHFSPSPAFTRWRIPSFNDLHLPALPWHRIICGLLNGEDIISYVYEKGQGSNIKVIRLYTREELENDKRWHNLSGMSALEDLELLEYNESDDREVLGKEAIQEFNPKFRIIISKKDN